MKHYDNRSQKNAPRHSAKPANGKRYASPASKPAERVNRDRYEKKTTELRIKRTAPADGDTRIYPVKKADVTQLEKRAKRPRTTCVGTPTAPVPPTKAGYAPAFLFAGFVLAMTLLFIFLPKLHFSESEKRYLADFPKTSAETVLDGSFGKGFETFIADHFPARNLWVGVNAYATLAEGNNGANGVYNAKDGYLINKPIPEKNQIKRNVMILQEFKETVGDVPMTAMFVPSTGYICDDKLPAIHDSYSDDAYFAEISKGMLSGGIDFVDLRQSFKGAYANGRQLYYKTDHHWTTEGAYTAYVAYCQSVGMTPAPRSSFTLEQYKDFYGTTCSGSGFLLNESDTVTVWNNPKNTADKISVRITDDDQTKTSNSMFFTAHDQERDKYPIFLDGNHALTEITNDNVKDGKIVVIKDSFSHCFAPFLAENYHSVILVDMRLFKQSAVSDLVKVEKPDQILCLYGIDNFAQDMDLPDLY